MRYVKGLLSWIGCEADIRPSVPHDSTVSTPWCHTHPAVVGGSAGCVDMPTHSRMSLNFELVKRRGVSGERTSAEVGSGRRAVLRVCQGREPVLRAGRGEEQC